MKRFLGSLALISVGLVASAGPVASEPHARVVIAFDMATDGTAEGVAVDSNGSLYTGLSAQGRMLRLDPGATDPVEVAVLDGLAEGDFGFTGHATDDRGQLYSAVVSGNPELNGVVRIHAGGRVEHIDGTEAMAMANGISALGDLFVSDSLVGSVWRVSFPLSSGGEPAVEQWVTDPLLQGTDAMPLPFPVGANGIVVRDGVVYVGVTEQSHVVGIPIHDDDAAGEPFVFQELPGVAVDGIAFDGAGNLYAADPPAHTLWKVTPDGTITAVADVDDGLSGPSSVALWSGDDGLVAYVSNQAIGDPSTIKHGPSIIAVSLD